MFAEKYFLKMEQKYQELTLRDMFKSSYFAA